MNIILRVPEMVSATPILLGLVVLEIFLVFFQVFINVIKKDHSCVVARSTVRLSRVGVRQSLSTTY